MSNKPVLSGNVQNNNSDDVGDSALWNSDSENDNAPRFQGIVNLRVSELRKLVNNNPDAEKIALSISLWHNEKGD